ncbi:ComF family protein [Polaribacter porphyrae]|uniref:Amidophosphoribosyltransferase n=1 Tax=Polaribacter porphyrae TaxID=1137780 RepID=A0A2S7WPV1_9FLAO|nr:ComF family protein [Polaribacter porphyrae]PQJ79648.1 amidophosphoribosyltransferase [Polaribacter porphyrae]
MKEILKNLVQIFYPDLCAICEDKLLQNEHTICTICRHDLPLTNITNYSDNKILHTFYGSVIIEKAFALLFYTKKGIAKKLIHELKYKDNEDIGIFFGNWIGEILKENEEFKNVDVIIPVPLHSKKIRERGYNQVTKFGERLSYHLQIPLVENNLVRISSTKTQTFKSRFERFTNVDTQFSLKQPKYFNNKHVLIIDDVITTGATLVACAKQFQKSKHCKISILTIAYTA